MTNPRPPLTPSQVKDLQAAQRLLQAGNAEGAIGRIRPLLAGGLVHADVYALFAAACRSRGLLAEARTSLNAAVNLDGANPRYWAALADLLVATGELSTARVAWDRVTVLSPEDDAAALALADVHLQLADGDAAETPLRTVLARNPASLRARHALALALRMQDRATEALEHSAAIFATDVPPAQSEALHGHLLGDLGRWEESEQAYRRVLAREPQQLDALDTLTRLLPQLGREAEALEPYRLALAAQPAGEALYGAALAAARSLGRARDLLEWSEAALDRFPANLGFAVHRADALGLTGDVQSALALLAPLAGRDADAAAQAAHWSLVAREPEAAARHAERATELAPDTQTGWAYLATAWRLLADPRANWLNDYDRLTVAMALEPPEGFSSTTDFLAELRSALDGMHLTLAHPADQSLRHGTQTRGHLFLRRHPLVTALALQLHRQIESWLTMLPKDASHPFLRRNSGQMLFKHSWSVRLSDSGFHVSHIHQDGWLSSAFYVALPPAVGVAGEGGLPQGGLTFGSPDATLGLDLPPERVLIPEEGVLALFPSYVWHGTVPFSSDQPRLTVAFDALPR